MPCLIHETASCALPVNDLRLIPADESLAEDWLALGPEPVQLLLAEGRRLLRLVYRRGELNPLTSVALLSRQPPDRRIWSRADRWDFRAARKDSSPETQALWLRRGNAHPALRRLAMITGQCSEMTASDWVEIRPHWRMVEFNFSDTLAEFSLLAFSTRAESHI